MDLFSFAATVILVTASGALAPGPLFFVTISHGARQGAKGGLVFSITHTLVEFSLVMLLASGLLTVANEHVVKFTVGTAGGVALFAFGLLQIHASLTSRFEKTRPGNIPTHNLVLMGLVFTGLNPFFIVWWLTAGANLILLSIEFASSIGVIFMYICHVWMDYLWLTSVAHFSRAGTDVLNFKWYRALIAIFGLILIYFGITFFINSLSL